MARGEREKGALSTSTSDWKNLLQAIMLRRWGLQEGGGDGKATHLLGTEKGFYTLEPRQKCFLGVSQVEGFSFSPFILRRTFLFIELAAVSCCRSAAVLNGLAKGECSALKKEITCPCQDAHAAQYLRESSAVANPQKSQFNLCLPLANKCVRLAENLPDSPPPPACQGEMRMPWTWSGQWSRNRGLDGTVTPNLHNLRVWRCVPPQAGSQPHHDHLGSREHKCHCS